MRQAITLLAVGMLALSAIAQAVDYDIVYVRMPRAGDDTHVKWADVFHPVRMEPGCDLMLLRPDGSEEMLLAGGNGAITDPFISFDGNWVYYCHIYDLRQDELNYQRDHLPYSGSDIFKINLTTREIVQLTHGEFTPNLGAGNWDESNPLNPPNEFNRLGYGVLNMGPCPVAGGRIAFVSNRNGYWPTKSFTSPTLQLYIMDDDGENVMPIAPMTIGSALHPTPLRDGRIAFSSYESQGLRDRRNWGIWTIWPDGRKWEPLVSSFKSAGAFHFMTQLGGGDIVVEDYYNLNNMGFGAFYRFPVTRPPGTPPFYSAFPEDNPPIVFPLEGGQQYSFKMAFTPWSLYSMTPFTHAQDNAAPPGPDGERVGKVTHPSAAPDGDMLCVWSPGPVNLLTRPVKYPAPDGGLYVVPNGITVSSPDELITIKNDPNYNEVWPRAVVPYSAVHGVEEPDALPWLPNDGTEHIALPRGTPYGLIGTSSFYKRESFPGSVKSWANTFDGLDAFNTTENGQSSNWSTQGSDAGIYDDSEIWAVRILSMEPNTHRSYGPNIGQHYQSFANERLRILGEIPLRKFSGGGTPILDPEGNPDTSFLAKIPADTPFTFQTINKEGMALNMAQTWHQLRPGEVRQDCGGCHAHSMNPLLFEQTYAARPDYDVWDLVTATPLVNESDGEAVLDDAGAGAANVEFHRDIRPILQAHCTQCHTETDPTPPGNLVLDDLDTYDGMPGDYVRLADDSGARWGYPPLVTVGGNPVWRQTNASRYVRKFQSRRSLLVWKVFGMRTDGWSNEDHPTESIPGDASSLPPDASINEADLDFTGSIMPPPDSGVPPLSEAQKRTIARWIDLGCPIDTSEGSASDKFGWFLDDLRPTLTIASPRPGENTGPLTEIRIGFSDAYKGVDPDSLSIRADFEVNGKAAGAELANLIRPAGDGIVVIPLEPPLADGAGLHVFAEIADNEGNIKRLDRRFSVGAGTGEGEAEGAEEGEAGGEGETEGEEPTEPDWHSADTNENFWFELSEMLRVIQLFRSRGYSCADSPDATEDGFVVGTGDTACAPHDSDYRPQDWRINISELLRLIQLYNLGGYHDCSEDETPGGDGFCAGAA